MNWIIYEVRRPEKRLKAAKSIKQTAISVSKGKKKEQKTIRELKDSEDWASRKSLLSTLISFVRGGKSNEENVNEQQYLVGLFHYPTRIVSRWISDRLTQTHRLENEINFLSRCVCDWMINFCWMQNVLFINSKRNIVDRDVGWQLERRKLFLFDCQMKMKTLKFLFFPCCSRFVSHFLELLCHSSSLCIITKDDVRR